ncbi:unnamed protein product, partial [Ilex paraguariensis]
KPSKVRVAGRPSSTAPSATKRRPPLSVPSPVSAHHSFAVKSLNPGSAVCNSSIYGNCIPTIGRRCTYEKRCKRGPAP